jgi:hypothetical protein
VDDDILALEFLRGRLSGLIDMRLAQGWTKTAMGAKHDHNSDFMNPKAPTELWKWSTFYGMADGAELDVTFKIADLPEPAGNTVPMFEMAKNAPAFLGVGLLEYFRAVRPLTGVTYRRLGDAMGIVESGVRKIEIADDPRLFSIMRYARGLGGSINFDVRIRT